jgi:hypothetical protein
MPRNQRPISQTRRDILRAFFVLERETGLKAFKYGELRKQVPHINPSTLGVHLLTRMNKGDKHLNGTEELETVGKIGRQYLVSLSSFGRQQIKDLRLDEG